MKKMIALALAAMMVVSMFAGCGGSSTGTPATEAPAAPRLACVKPVTSVHPEPGSNSSL